MRKLMAICLTIAMALSMCSFTVMAEGEATFAEIANGQPVDFVIADLDLGSHTITSSNELIIAEDGTVTRPLMEDAVVQVAIDGGETIDVTVKAKVVNALYVNDFSEDVGEGWTIGCPEGNTPSSVADGKFNVIIGATTVNRTNVTYTMPSEVDYTKPVSIKFDVDNFTDITASGADIRLNGGVYNADGTSYKAFPSSAFARVNAASGFSSSYFTAGKDIDFKYDPMTGEIWTLATGALSAKTLVDFAMSQGTIPEGGAVLPEGGYVKITGLTLCNAGGGCTATFDVDDFVVYQELDAEDVLADATDAEKAAYYATYLDEEFVADGGSFKAVTENLKFAADEEFAAGVSINWESSDETVIATDGTVTRPFFEEKEVTINGALVINGEEVATAEYVVNVLPLAIGSATEIADAENLALGSFAGADGWTPAAIKDWEAMEVKEDTDGNKYYSISASSYQPSGSLPKYTFASNPTFGEGDTLVFEAKVRVPVKGGTANWGLELNGNEMAEFIYFQGYLYDNDYDLGNDDYYGPSAARRDKLVTAGTWYNIKFEIVADEAATKGATVKCYIDGNLVGTHSTKNAIPAEITSASFYLKGRSNMDSTNDAEVTTPVYFFDTDDIRVYTSKDVASVLASLDDAGKAAFFAELAATTEFLDVTTGQTLALDSAYADYDLDALGVSVAWKSGNTEYITDEGTVKKLAPAGEKVVVDMIATVTVGNETATGTAKVELGDGLVLINSVDYSDTSVNVGSVAQIVTDDAAHGSVVYMANAEAKHKSSNTIANVSGGDKGDRLVLEADVKYVHGASETASGGFGVATQAGRRGIQVSLNYRTKKISLITTVAEANGDAKSIIVKKDPKTVSYPMPESVIEKGEGEWVHITIDHNALSQTYQVYVDGILINKVPVLQAQMALGDTNYGLSVAGSSIRGYSIELSLEGEMWVDNVSLKKYANTDAVEVNAALNAALVQYAAEEVRPVLANCELPAMTIGKSWNKGTYYDRDIVVTRTEKVNTDGTPVLDKDGNQTYKYEFAYNPENFTTYKYVTDGPALTYAVNGEAVTEINVDKPAVVDFTVTASANGITESFTVKRKVAPMAIRSLAQGTASCLNGLWLEGAKGTEKVMVVSYDENNKIVTSVDEEGKIYPRIKTFNLADLADVEINVEEGRPSSYHTAMSLLEGIGVEHPSVDAKVKEVKIFVFGGNGVAPVTFRSGIVEW